MSTNRLYQTVSLLSLCQLCKDLELRGQLEQLRSELAPLEKKYLEMAEKSDRHREIVTWAGG